MRHYPQSAFRDAPVAPFPFSRAAPHAAPLVEVLVPLFDAAGPLADTLASVAAQSWPNWAVAIQDDGSRDGGPDLAAAFGDAISDRPVRVLSGPHRGPARNLLAAIRAADPRADHALAIPAGAVLPADLLAALPTALAGDIPELRLVAGRGAAGEIGFEAALAGRVPRRAGLAMNRAALDLLRVAAAWTGPLGCPVAWAAQVVAGGGGRVAVMAVRTRIPGFGAAASRAEWTVDALRATGPLLLPAARRRVEELAAQAPRRPWQRLGDLAERLAARRRKQSAV